ncbi:RNA polymerase sigma factor [Bosea sp. BIWAKO-01]|uniref:RNA polymerase sigma factor n=1 Tax=Bosea sp. BIWAKO-01 TaxID=506668 RepID=UPI000853E89E|nr:sigma-70 family RNA polymerase sigma factor [Bosea sp. BIWAKO-01]GAU84832.1 ECF family RNA polymerase sigma-70 factor [Bosea sp. BIWAKO-01]
MSDAAPDPRSVSCTIENVVRTDRGRLLSALIVQLKNFQLAEDALQDALASAVVHWGRTGLPASPQGWLLKVALRKAIDRLRKSAREDREAGEIARLSLAEAAETTTEDIADERLRLIFTCCHPALEPKTRVALTLRTLGGLSTAEVAAAFLDNETTMGQRLSRARTKILAAGIPYAVPGPEAWSERLQSVLTVVYLIFNQAYSGADESHASPLGEEAIYLARMLNGLRPDQAEIEGLLALMLITEARRAARLDAGGTSIPLALQDRRLWDGARIAEGLALLDRVVARRAPGPFQIKAAIAALHVQVEPPDWPQIVLLYDSLLRMEPTPVVQLNRAAALAEAGALRAGLHALGSLASALSAYQPFHAAHAELLSRSGSTDAALAAFDRAIGLASNPSDALFLRCRRDQVARQAPETS